jgi:hypothetical protein
MLFCLVPFLSFSDRSFNLLWNWGWGGSNVTRECSQKKRLKKKDVCALSTTANSKYWTIKHKKLVFTSLNVSNICSFSCHIDICVIFERQQYLFCVYLVFTVWLVYLSAPLRRRDLCIQWTQSWSCFYTGWGQWQTKKIFNRKKS